MCGLCQLQGVFGNPVGEHDPLDTIKTRAAQLKRVITIHENVARKRAQAGEEPCEVSVARLTALKAEQYELAHKL